MLELSMTDWVLVGLCALMVGVTKTGVPGFGILVVPLMAMALPARLSVGALLGILILADVFAAIYYRRHAQWSQIARLLPAAFAGVVVGYFCLKFVSDEQLRPIIGVIILLLFGVHFFKEQYYGDESKIPKQLWFAVGMGFLAGVVTMMANAAGPVVVIYLLAMRLDKKEFIGTRAWFFFIINWIKVPFGANLELITAETVKLDLIMLPVIAVGAVTGILILKYIPQKTFRVVVQILAATAAIKLLF